MADPSRNLEQTQPHLSSILPSIDPKPSSLKVVKQLAQDEERAAAGVMFSQESQSEANVEKSGKGPTSSNREEQPQKPKSSRDS